MHKLFTIKHFVFKENKNMAEKPDKDAVLIEEKNLEDTQNTSDK